MSRENTLIVWKLDRVGMQETGGRELKIPSRYTGQGKRVSCVAAETRERKAVSDKLLMRVSAASVLWRQRAVGV